MFRWKDINIGLKLKISFAVLILLIISGGFFSYITLESLVVKMHYMFYLDNVLINFREKEVKHLDWRHYLRNAIEEGNYEKLKDIERDVRLCPLGKWFYSDERKKLTEHIPTLSPLFIELEPLHNKLHESADKIYKLFLKNDKTSKEKAFYIFKTETLPITVKLRELLHNIMSEIKKASEAEDVKVLNSVNIIIQLTIIFAILALIIAIFMSVFIVNSITKPINEALDITMQIAEGKIIDFKAPDNKDETGQLLTAMSKMSKVLKSHADAALKIANGDLSIDVQPISENDIFGKAFKQMTLSLRHQVTQINELTSVIASASAEIMASATQIASSVTETSASITETTTTVEQVRQTAHVSSQKAQNVSDISRKTSEVSMSGSAAVDDTIKQMNEIRQQMESIADSIVKLSEQTHSISEIISTVNDIAEQSNLLAVNASIEAAKAGEHGKGFAVVASEVRSLAQQSKHATAQIKTIINDIQKAINTTVLVTEQGGKVVTSGVKLSAEAGASIKSLSKSIFEASQAASQIAVSNQQQLAGMDQIVIAMENIKHASIQNAESIKQVEIAAKNLNDMMQRLKLLADKYKV